MPEPLVAERTYGKDFLPYCLAPVRGFYRTMKRRHSLGTGGERARLLLNAPMCFSSSSSAWGVDGVGPGWPIKSAVFYSCRRCSRSWHDFHSSPVTKGRWWGRYRWCWCRLCCWCRPLFLASHVYIDIVRLKSRYISSVDFSKHPVILGHFSYSDDTDSCSG